MMYVTNSGILVSDEEDRKLRFFSKILGCSDIQFRTNTIHRYELTQNQRDQALIYGAKLITDKELAAMKEKQWKTQYDVKVYERRTKK